MRSFQGQTTLKRPRSSKIQIPTYTSYQGEQKANSLQGILDCSVPAVNVACYTSSASLWAGETLTPLSAELLACRRTSNPQCSIHRPPPQPFKHSERDNAWSKWPYRAKYSLVENLQNVIRTRNISWSQDHGKYLVLLIVFHVKMRDKSAHLRDHHNLYHYWLDERLVCHCQAHSNSPLHHLQLCKDGHASCSK